ncbi:MAG: PBSX family phage terminase large subunit [Phenylobacterium sp.]|uniref:PBSX family phage terminase large subunit n=1 Tax=Phenylobacterium sp. TaxID=1871053 RepID=UPI00271A351D|nr:PBSX family phage terminase large subunit [Phenylobacterium sp.]MDO8912309.1 PBSX family phage terminase large subunit [Phenylobacterium sp.]MDP3099521.1 PBSX family phage terminase large subunit [Phenylobacterium sp.]
MAARTPSEAIPGGSTLQPARIGHNGGPTLNPVLRDFWTTPARNRVLKGGRSSSKSWDAAGFAIFLASNYKVRFLCTRQFQNKIEESVYTLLKIQIERFGLQAEFDILNNKIVHKTTGSEFIFYGLWRHIDEIKSLEGIDVCWIEEAHNLTLSQWEILEPTLRKEGSQFWIIFNPRLATDFVYKRFVTNRPPDTIVRTINYTENPFLSNTILKVIEAKREEDEDEFRHIYLGEPRTDDDAAIIKRSWVLAAIGAREALGVPRGGRRRIGFDVADGGADKNATVEVEGFEVVAVDEWKAGEDELLKSATRVHAQARVTGAEIDYDSIGVGAFAGAHFEQLNELTETSVEHFKFNAGAGVLNPDNRIDDNPKSPTNLEFYANLKAQTWWDVADRLRHTFNAVIRGLPYDIDRLISIDPECDHLDGLIDELCTPRKDFDNAGRSKVESKKDLAKPNRVGGPQVSPNKADAFVMAYAPREATPTVAVFLKRRHRT